MSSPNEQSRQPPPGSDKLPIRFECQNVKKFYQKKLPGRKKEQIPALDGLNISLYDHKINALVGHSGSGKSTLAKILMKLESFDSGDISYKKEKLDSIEINSFRQKNQILFQNPFLAVNPAFSIYKIIADPLKVARKSRQEIKNIINQVMELINIPHSFLKRYPSELSGGELQRIALARSLVLEPEFVILDEPFSSLDEIMASRLMDEFRFVFKKLNIGILYISHHLKRVSTLADFVAVIKKGKIIEQGPVDQINLLYSKFII
ncbi:MAG: ABC transporter ATP-binding protein [Candidatus Aminicenantes bacterium]|nr:ABC transporter ATP-binding protein [Candidatus Aminicenantes bacterium]